MNIYVNGEITEYENIFDLLDEKKNSCPWEYVSALRMDRDPVQVLDEWVKTGKTYYCIEGERYNFELK